MYNGNVTLGRESERERAGERRWVGWKARVGGDFTAKRASGRRGLRAAK